MSKSSLVSWVSKTILMIGMPLLSSCQKVPFCPMPMEEIKRELAEGAEGDCCVKSCPSIMPVEISRAMTPDLSYPAAQDIPVIEKRFDINADKVPANVFFLSLVQDTPYNVNIHPDVSGSISVQLKKVTILEVLASVRNVYGFDFKRTAQMIEIFPATLQTRTFKINYLDFKRGGDSEIQVTAGGLKSSGSSGGSGTTGTSLPSENASTPEGSSSQQVYNSKISTNSNSDFWKELKTALETIVGSADGRKVSVSPMSGLVVVQAMPAELRKVAEYLRNAQLTLNRQVILEAKILEVELNDSFQAGINWTLLSGRLRATQFGGQVVSQVPNVDGTFPPLNTNLSPPIPLSPGRVGPNGTINPTFDAGQNAGTFGGVFAMAMNYKNISTFVELLSAQGKVHVLSSPRISTLNNQKALIKVGTDRFYITSVNTTQTSLTGGGVVPTQNVTFDPFFSGIALDVTPSINACDEITLHVHPMVSVVTDDLKTYSLSQPGVLGISSSQTSQVTMAASTVRESDSVVRAKTGQMVIIGGLMKDQSQKLKEGLPILKDLPVFGQLFGHTVEKTKKSELVILIRPVVVNDDTWPEKITDSLDRYEELDTECK